MRISKSLPGQALLVALAEKHKRVPKTQLSKQIISNAVFCSDEPDSKLPTVNKMSGFQ